MRLVQPVGLRFAMVRLLLVPELEKRLRLLQPVVIRRASLVPEPEKRLRLLQPVVIRRASGFLARLWVSNCHR